MSQLKLQKVIFSQSEILGVLVTKLTPNYEYSRSNNDNLPLPLQMELSEKLQQFFGIFIAFLESALNFQHYKKKQKLLGSSISEVNDCQKVVDSNV